MIIVAGEALVDLVIDPAGEVVAAIGGGPFNTARAVARLGSHSSFFGSISNDRFGTMQFQRLVDDGVDPVMTQRSDLPTSLAAAELDETGSATYRFYLAETAAPNLAPVALAASTVAFHVGTLGLVPEPMATTVEQAVATAHEDVLVMFDINCRPKVIIDRVGYLRRVFNVLRRSDVVKVSSEDLDYLELAADYPTARRRLIELGATTVLHTDGGSAVHICTAADEAMIDVTPVEVVDTIGAGDAFGGAFLAWWTQSGLRREHLGDIELALSAARAAVVVAGITCTRVGADSPFVAELGDQWRPLA